MGGNKDQKGEKGAPGPIGKHSKSCMGMRIVLTDSTFTTLHVQLSRVELFICIG